MIDIFVEDDELKRRLNFVSKHVMSKTVQRSLNRTLDGMYSQAQKLTAAEIKLKRRDIKEGMEKFPAKSSVGMAWLSILAKPITLYKYASSSKQTKQGVRVNVKGTKKVVKGAFLATMKTGHIGIFKRKTNKSLPIQELFSSSVRDVFKDDRVVDEIQSAAEDRFKKEFRTNFKFYMGGS